MIKDIEYLAKTIYGEARGENLETRLYVAWVIRNRVEGPGWFGETYEEVCTKPKQFSCWNKDDPNYPKIQAPKGKHWLECKAIAQAVYLADERHNPIPGVYHYYDISINPPYWVKSEEQIVRFDYIPRIRFVKGVA